MSGRLEPGGGFSLTPQGGLTPLSLSGVAQGDVLYYNGTNWVNLGPGTSGLFLKTQGAGANPVWASAGGGASMTLTTDYTAAVKYSIDKINSGADTYVSSGLHLVTGATQASFVRNLWTVFNNTEVHLGSPLVSTHIYLPTIGTDFNAFFGISGSLTIDGTSITWTNSHAGFSIKRAASGATSLYATQADGTTENISSALTTLSANDDLDLIIKVNSTTSIDYYWRKGNGALSSATNLTSNFPGFTSYFFAGVTNMNVATSTIIDVAGVTYTRS